jgi:hypothetical protein
MKTRLKGNRIIFHINSAHLNLSKIDSLIDPKKRNRWQSRLINCK